MESYDRNPFKNIFHHLLILYFWIICFYIHFFYVALFFVVVILGKYIFSSVNFLPILTCSYWRSSCLNHLIMFCFNLSFLSISNLSSYVFTVRRFSILLLLSFISLQYPFVMFITFFLSRCPLSKSPNSLQRTHLAWSTHTANDRSCGKRPIKMRHEITGFWSRAKREGKPSDWLMWPVRTNGPNNIAWVSRSHLRTR